MDSNRIKDIDSRHDTQDENWNGARDASMRKTGKDVQDLAGDSRENDCGVRESGRTREGAQNGVSGVKRIHGNVRNGRPEKLRESTQSRDCECERICKSARNGMRGGARPGAGRPRGDSRMISFRAPGALADRLDEVENRTEFIKESIAKALRDKEFGIAKIGDVMPAGKVEHVNIPFFDIRVVAGFPVPLDNDEKSQDIDLIRMLCPHPEASYLIRVNGDSMIDAGVLSGDIVIVDKSNRNPSPREIAMCELNGEYTLKHFRMEDGQGWLVPANPDYPRIRISPEDDFSVWGTVTFIIHKPRD